MECILRVFVVVSLVHLAVNAENIEIKMPGVKPLTEDKYLCTSIPVTKEGYITQYEALADAGTAHHILLFGCDEPYRKTPTWTCGQTCKANSQIMFAWARNAQATHLPDNVGYHIGGSSQINHIVMQVHYARAMKESEPEDHSGLKLTITDVKPKYSQGILLMISSWGIIPAHTKESHLDVSCRYSGSKPIHPFAFRTHAHSLSRVISAYQKPANNIDAPWTKIGKGNPLWPQAFYPMKDKSLIIHPDDYLAARCVYDSTDKAIATQIGGAHTDEMCNFYVMYYTEGEAKFETCGGNQFKDLAKTMPADSLVKLPPNPLLDEMAAGHPMHHNDEPAEDRSATTQPSLKVKVEDHEFPYLYEAEDWYTAPNDINVGQIGGIATDKDGNVVIFHRGSHKWDYDSFDKANRYLKEEDGAINEKAIVVFDDAGQVKDSWGDNMFYLPHGITIDDEGNYYLTDVALHQVMKFAPSTSKTTPLLTLGEKFISGAGEEQFCQPADVAVASNGDFYVADGYCNGRVMKFDKNGHVIGHFGALGIESMVIFRFFVVHSLALSETLNTLCVADREHKRLQCFDQDGMFKYEVKDDKPVFAAAFKPNTDKLLTVSSRSMPGEIPGSKISLLHMREDSAENMGDFYPNTQKFGGILHDLAVSHDGSAAYIGQLDPPKIWKFMISIKDSADSVIDAKEVDNPTVKKTGLEVVNHKPIVSKDEQIGTDNGASPGSQKVPIVVGAMLIVPVVCVLIILLGFKIYNSRKRKGIHGQFDMGSIFSSRPSPDKAGFSPLTAQEDHYTESEDEGLYEKQQMLKH